MKVTVISFIVVIVLGGIIYAGTHIHEQYYEEHQTTGKIVGVSWECWSCNTIRGVNDATSTADLDRVTRGGGRVANCFTLGNRALGYNNTQRVTFYVGVDTPLGHRTITFAWRRRGSVRNEFALPMVDLPPKGTEVPVVTTLSGENARWLEEEDEK